jgi:type IV secretion system protein VirD4
MERRVRENSHARCGVGEKLEMISKTYLSLCREGSAIIIDNCQDILFGGFAPNSESAEILSKALGNKTVMSGSISRGKNDPSQSLQMIQRPLMTPDELKTLPKGSFILAKTGCCPMRTTLKLFLKWGIVFEKSFEVEEKAVRKVAYADRFELEQEIIQCNCAYEDDFDESSEPPDTTSGGSIHTPVPEPTEVHQGMEHKPPLRTD